MTSSSNPSVASHATGLYNVSRPLTAEHRIRAGMMSLSVRWQPPGGGGGWSTIPIRSAFTPRSLPQCWT